MKFPSRALGTLLPLFLLAPVQAFSAPSDAQPINVSSLNLTRTAMPSAWKSTLDQTSKIGVRSTGIFCSGATDLYYTPAVGNFLDAFTRRTYLERAAALGYPKFDNAGSAFGDKTGNDPDFKVGFTLLGWNFNTCTGIGGVKGSATLKLRVELYSAQAQKVVYSREIEGSYNTEASIKGADFEKAYFGAAMNQLFADPAFVEVFKSGGEAAVAPAADRKLTTIAAAPKFVGGVSKNAKSLLSAVVTIDSGHGVGSGFYISRDGYLLTNMHVVGGAKYVKVKLAEGHSLVGEVIKIDSARDVALVKTDSSPANVIPIRGASPQVGEEVYAIGSPLGEALSGTVTRGVVSALREVEHNNFVQSDAAINPGNSGGPLLDGNGAVVAIADMKARGVDGIALFIPIAEALDKLDLKLAN